MSKTIPLLEGLEKYHIEDYIKFYPDNKYDNPKGVYKLLDKDKRKFRKKFGNIELCPSCYGGLISCNYYIRMEIRINEFYSYNDFIIPIDLYEPYIPINNGYYDINQIDLPEKEELQKTRDN